MMLTWKGRRLDAIGLAVLTAVSGCGGSDVQTPGDDGESVTAGCKDGTLSGSSAPYQVCFPATWNGDLVVYAHGYVSSDEPLALPDDQVDGRSVAELVTGLGYAYATTSYRANGLVADVAVEDVAEVVAVVRQRIEPNPARAFVVGVSEGGLVAALAAERRADVFDGAVAACGPVGDFAAQIDYFGDFRVVFDYYFPGVIPGGPVDIPDEVRVNWNSVYVPAIAATLQSDIPATLQLLSVTGAPTDPQDLLSAGAKVIGALRYDVFALRDARARLGGQPYDNIGRVYHGSLDDDALNAGVARVAADAGARGGLASFETTGELAVPAATIHTTGDPIVPALQSERYADKVTAAGAGALLDTHTVSRYGHCAFTQSEVLEAFNSVVSRAAAATRVD